MSAARATLPRGVPVRFAAILAFLLVLGAIPASAGWIASGTFLYEDRRWDQNGFTGTIAFSPVRYADVEVVDVNQKSANKSVLAHGRTDANGSFSIAVSDGSVRAVRVRALARSTETPDLFVKVVSSVTGSVWAVSSGVLAGHGPNTNVNFGSLVAAAGAGGEPFNIFDLGVYGADYVRSLTGSRPGPSKLVTFRWAGDGGISGSATSGNTVSLRDSAGYDDTPILHEWAHYIMNNYSKSSSPAGAHRLADCNEDIRLAFDEGRASFFGCSVRRYYGWPNANIYLRTDGGSGAGHVVLLYDLESETQYICKGDTSEVTVSRSLWDIGDGPATTDFTVGAEDAQDRMSRPDAETWEVFTGPIRSATYVSDESFWDGWFDPAVANGYLLEMSDIFACQGIEFRPDASEPNDTLATATPIMPNTPPLHLTFFADPDGNGKGAADTDLFSFVATAGGLYTVETLNLLSDGNTKLEVLDTNGTTVLASNNDRSSTDLSSFIAWTAPRSGVFYIRSTHATDHGIYGSYDLKLSK